MSINIQVGEIVLDRVTKQKIIYPNKSRKYLLPCMKEYGKEFTNKLSNVFKVAVGIGDIVVRNRGFKHEKHLFILIDTKIAHSFFVDFINFVREHEAYQNDYVFGDIQKSTFHMVIVKFPVQHYEAFETFKIGDYSKMFKKQDIDKFFANHPVYRRVLIKDDKYRIKFAVKLSKIFGTEVKPEDIKGELDLAPREEEEVFNTHISKKIP